MSYIDISPKSLEYNKWPPQTGRYRKKHYSAIEAAIYRASQPYIPKVYQTILASITQYSRLKAVFTPFNLLYCLKEQRMNICRSKGNLHLLSSYHFLVILSQLASRGNIATPQWCSQIALGGECDRLRVDRLAQLACQLIGPDTCRARNRRPLIWGFCIRDPGFSSLNSSSLDSYLKIPTKRYRGPIQGIGSRAQPRARIQVAQSQDFGALV